MSSVPPPRVFISYSHDDEAWKDRLVRQLRVLELEGDLELWDDRRIDAGDEWLDEITDAIDGADVALLLVTASFLTSPFIRKKELTRILKHRASQRLRVVPVIVKACPWQAVDWLASLQARPIDGRPLSAGSDHQIESDLADLALELRDLQRLATVDGAGEKGPAPLVSTARRPRWTRLAPLLWFTLPTLVLILVATLAEAWKLPTRVALDAVTRRLALVVDGEDRQQILDRSVSFSALGVEKCTSVSFPATLLEQLLPADEAGVDRASSDFSAVEGKQVRFGCDDPDAKLSLRPPSGATQALGTLDEIRFEPGSEVALTVSGKGPTDVTIDVSTPQSLSLAVGRELELVTEFVDLEIDGVDYPLQHDLASWRVQLEEDRPFLDVESRGSGLVLVVTPTSGPGGGVFKQSLNVPLRSIQLFDESLEGEIEPSLLADAKLSYPGYPTLPPDTLEAREFVALGELERFRLVGLALDAETGGMEVEVGGVVDRLRTGDDRFPVDRRLSLFDRFRYSSRWNLFAALAAWGLSTTWLVYERWKKVTARAAA